MQTPAFYDQVRRLSVYDPLAEFLGAAEGGRIEYAYLDAVKLAGHSCPTVAAAYWMTLKALAHLYPDNLPQRGRIRVEFRQDQLSGVTGVIASVVTLLTGATHDTGFKGLAGRFDRRKLLYFSADVVEEIRFTRIDTGRAVEVSAQLQSVPFAPQTIELMQKCLNDSATPQEAAEFRECWQARVCAVLLEHGDDPQVFVLRPVA
ncbi:MAG: FmdE family protein [Betaproteobacteria bacterium]|nr:FmdE family protein [Betaproteobacteria bacterium]